jgi:hypothetical protein
MKGSRAREERENKMKKHCSPEPLFLLNKVHIHIDLHDSKDMFLKENRAI